MEYDSACSEHAALIAKIRAKVLKTGTTKACVIGFAERLAIPVPLQFTIRNAPTMAAARKVFLGYLDAISRGCASGDTDVIQTVMSHLQTYAPSLSPEGRLALAKFFAMGNGVERFGDVFTNVMREQNPTGRVLTTKAAMRAWGRNLQKIQRDMLIQIRDAQDDPEFAKKIDGFLDSSYATADRTNDLRVVPGAGEFVGQSSGAVRATAESTKNEAMRIVESMSGVHHDMLSGLNWTAITYTDRKALVKFYQSAIESLADLKLTLINSVKKYSCTPALRMRQGSSKQVFSTTKEAAEYYINESKCTSLEKDVRALDRLYRLLVDGMGRAIESSPEVQSAVDRFGNPSAYTELLEARR